MRRDVARQHHNGGDQDDERDDEERHHRIDLGMGIPVFLFDAPVHRIEELLHLVNDRSLGRHIVMIRKNAIGISVGRLIRLKRYARRDSLALQSCKSGGFPLGQDRRFPVHIAEQIQLLLRETAVRHQIDQGDPRPGLRELRLHILRRTRPIHRIVASRTVDLARADIHDRLVDLLVARLPRLRIESRIARQVVARLAHLASQSERYILLRCR